MAIHIITEEETSHGPESVTSNTSVAPVVPVAHGQWKAVAHPLRLAILRLLAERGPQTNEELAKALGEASGKLYFHTKKLLDAGLIASAGTRQKGPLTEKLYKAVARRFVAPEPIKGGDGETPPLEPFVAAGLELYRSVWRETDGLSGGVELGYHLVLPQTPEKRRAFADRLRALMDEFTDAAAPAADPDARPLALTVLLHDAGTLPVSPTEKGDDA